MNFNISRISGMITDDDRGRTRFAAKPGEFGEPLG